MKRRDIAVVVILLLADFLLLGYVAVEAQTRIGTSDEVNKKAEADWKRTLVTPDNIDRFIKKYPNSQITSFALAARYSLLRFRPTLKGYNDFCERYADTYQGSEAIKDLFDLYLVEDRISGYWDFVRRYPGTIQALVAQERMTELCFEYACTLNELETYEEFIEFFPSSPYVKSVDEKAYECELEAAREEFKTYKDSGDKKAIEDSLRRRIEHYKSLLNEATVYKSRVNESNPGTEGLAYIVCALKAKRRSRVIHTLYDERERYLEDSETIKSSISDFEQAEFRAELLTVLNDIQNTLNTNHRELLAALQEHTETVCKTLRVGFDKLVEDNEELRDEVNRGFNTVSRGLDSLRYGMNRLHDDIENINLNLLDIKGSLEKTNDRLDAISDSLITINEGVEDLLKVTSAGFIGLDQLIKQFNRDVNDNFQREFYYDERQLESLGVVNETLTNGFNKVAENQEKLISTVDKGFDKVTEKQDEMKSTVQKGFDEVTKNQDEMKSTVREGFDEVTEKLLEEIGVGRQTVELIESGFANEQEGRERQLALARATQEVANEISETSTQQLRMLDAIHGTTEKISEDTSSIGDDVGVIRRDVNVMKTDAHVARKEVNDSLKAIYQTNREFREEQKRTNKFLEEQFNQQAQEGKLGRVLKYAAIGFTGAVVGAYVAPALGATAAFGSVVGGTTTGFLSGLFGESSTSDNDREEDAGKMITGRLGGRLGDGVLNSEQASRIVDAFDNKKNGEAAVKMINNTVQADVLLAKSRLTEVALQHTQDETGLDFKTLQMISGVQNEKDIEAILPDVAERVGAKQEVLRFEMLHL